VLAACFINDLGTVLALGFIFAPFTCALSSLPRLQLSFSQCCLG
jgi:hypothetical protein